VLAKYSLVRVSAVVMFIMRAVAVGISSRRTPRERVPSLSSLEHGNVGLEERAYA
jgi:hypothetical protein